MRKITTLLCFCLLCGSCTAAETGVLGISQSGQEFVFKTGDKVQIKLEENPTTGYGWNFFWNPQQQNIAGDISETYQQDEAAPEMVGVGGMKIYEFTMKNKGKAELTGYYYRPWEKVNEKTDKRVSYTFVVQ